MAKSKGKNKTGQIVMLGAALLGLVAIFLMFAPGITSKAIVANRETGTSSISGFKLIFGTEDGYKFNFMMFLSLIFTAVGIVGAILGGLLNMKLGNFLALGGFLLAGIFFFLFRAVFPMGVGDMAINGTTVLSGKDAIKALEEGVSIFGVTTKTTFSLGVGAIVAGILSIVAALASAAATFALKK